MTPTVEQLASCIISLAEGLRLTAYQDSGGVWTIGHGRTAGVKPGDTCTPDQAALWLAEDSASLFRMVAGKPVLAAAALVSFGYNCGSGSLGKILAGLDTQANPKYTHDRKGNVLPGLVNRRRLEAILIELSGTSTD